MKPTGYSPLSYCLLFCLQAVTEGADFQKLNNTTALNLGGSWNSAGAVPGGGDIMLWDSLIPDAALNAISPIGGNMSVAGLKVTNVSGTRNQATRGIGALNPSSANTLTIGASGIDMSAALQPLLIQSKILLGSDQTWTIANASTSGSPLNFNNNEDLGIQSMIAGTAFDLNGKTLTTAGPGQITVTSGHTIGNGTLIVGNNLMVLQGGASLKTTLQGSLNLQVTGGTLRLQSNSGAGGVSLDSSAPISVTGPGILELRDANATNNLLQSGAITLNAGATLSHIIDRVGTTGIVTTSGPITVAGDSTWLVSGTGGLPAGVQVSGAISGSGNINYSNTGATADAYPRLTGNNSGYSGTITINASSGARSLRLASADSGSATANWAVGGDNLLQVDGVSVQLGSLNGSGKVINTHASAAASITVGSGLFTGPVSNGTASTMAVTKVGPGELSLLGTNTYSGLTTVSQGSLVTTPASIGTGSVSVADGAGFGVRASVADTTLTLGNLTVGSTSGGTILLDYGALTNPGAAVVAVNQLGFHGSSTIKVSGANLSTGTIPLIQYSSLEPGSTPANALGLVLPPRMSGTLSDNGAIINLNIASAGQIRWNGNLSDVWDIDAVGDGSAGSANWRTSPGNVATRYIQGPTGSDSVVFNDLASGSGTVNLSVDVAPRGFSVDNNTKNYTFAGDGKLTGSVTLIKSGPGNLTLGNTTPYDYTGGTLVESGTLRLGDGSTPGSGLIPGSITNNGILVLNRPDDFTLTNPITGDGLIEKAQENTVTVPAAVAHTGGLLLSGGRLRFAAGGSLYGVISGSGGQLEAAGGTLEILGNEPNTNTALTTVNSGNLRLNNFGNAVGGDIAITGNGILTIAASDQVPDTATISALGSATDSLQGAGNDTFANAIVNGATTGMQFILRNGQTVTGTATVQQGYLGIASGHTATVNAVVMSGPNAIVRVGGSSGASTLNVGAGGITASAGKIEVKFNTNNNDATLNLAGDLGTTGNFAFTNADYPGSNLNLINLSGNRSFNIGSGTTTTIAPDLNSTTESLSKNGDGTLVLNPSCAANIGGGTTVMAGALIVNGTLTGDVIVNPAGTLGGSGSLSGAAQVAGTLAPGTSTGNGIGALGSTAAVSFLPDSDLAIGISNWAGSIPGSHWDILNTGSLIFTATPANPLTIHVSNNPLSFTETSKTLNIAHSATPITGFDPAAIVIDASGFSGSGTWAVQSNGSDVDLVYTAAGGGAYGSWASAAGLSGGNNGPSDDPDHDRESNIAEFALDGMPLSGKSSKKVVGKIGTVGGQQVLTLTLPVRGAAVFSGTTELSASVDGATYRIQASDQLSAWTLQVSEVLGADAAALQSGLPALSPGWSYRSFRSPGPIAGDPTEHIRVKISAAP